MPASTGPLTARPTKPASGALDIEITELADTGQILHSEISPDGNWYVAIGDGEVCINPTGGGNPTCVASPPRTDFAHWAPNSTRFLHGATPFAFGVSRPLLVTGVDGITSEVVSAPDDGNPAAGFVYDAVFTDTDTIAYLWVAADTTVELRQITVDSTTPVTLLRFPSTIFPEPPLVIGDDAAYLRLGSGAGPYESGVHRFAFDGSDPQQVSPTDGWTVRNSRNVPVSMWPHAARGGWVVSAAENLLGDFARNRGVGPFFYLSSPDGTAETFIPPVDPGYVNTVAALSPDGTLIAVFASYIDDDPTVRDSERGNLVAVADTATILSGQPNWSQVGYIPRPTRRISRGESAVFWEADNRLHATTANGMYTITVTRS